MSEPDPIRAMIEQAEIAGQEIQALYAQLEELRDADRRHMVARVKPHWDFYRDAVERDVRERVAREIEAEREKLEQWSSTWSRPLTMAAAIARGGDRG